MATKTMIGLLAALLLAAPLALAQNDTGGDNDVTINPPDNVDVNVDGDDDGVDESTGFGWSTTTVLIVIVVAVLLVALVVALAVRGRDYP